MAPTPSPGVGVGVEALVGVLGDFGSKQDVFAVVILHCFVHWAVLTNFYFISAI